MQHDARPEALDAAWGPTRSVLSVADFRALATPGEKVTVLGRPTVLRYPHPDSREVDPLPAAGPVTTTPAGRSPPQRSRNAARAPHLDGCDYRSMSWIVITVLPLTGRDSVGFNAAGTSSKEIRVIGGATIRPSATASATRSSSSLDIGRAKLMPVTPLERKDSSSAT